MTQETAKERIYREALEKTRDRLDGFEELYANKEAYYAFDELTGLVEKGLSQASKIPSTTDKLSVEKLQEQLNTAKKALKESEKMYQKQMDRFLNSEVNESARSHCESQLKLLFPAHKAYEALAAIGGDGCPVGAVGKNGLTKEELEGSGDE